MPSTPPGIPAWHAPGFRNPLTRLIPPFFLKIRTSSPISAKDPHCRCRWLQHRREQSV